MITNDARLQIDLDPQDVTLIRELVRVFRFSIDTMEFGAEATKLILNKKDNSCKVNPSGTVASNTASSNQMRKIMVWFVSNYEPPTKTTINNIAATLDGEEINISKTTMTRAELAEIVKLITDTPITLK